MCGSGPDTMAQLTLEEIPEGEKARARLKRDALSAWHDYRSTGLHATQDEIDTWLAGLEEGEPIDLPAPHT